MYDHEELTYLNECANEHYSELELDKQRIYIKELLVGDVLRVNFTKKNGDAREMYCTLQDEFVPEHKQYFKKGSKIRENNMEVLSVFDMEKGDWRSFRIENVIDFAIVREEDLTFEFDKNDQDLSDIPF